jgi:putative hemolysin
VDILEIALGIVVGLAVAAFFAGCEGAFFALQAPAEQPSGENVRPEISLLRRPDRLQHGIALGHLLSTVWLMSLAWSGARRMAGGDLGALSATATVGVTAFVVLVFAELVPKAIGVERPVSWTRRAGGPLAAWMFVTAPATALLAGLARRSRQLVGSSPLHAPFSSEDARSIMAETSERSDLEAGERQMITSIFSFGETTAREVMTPRPDVVAVDIGTPWEEVVRRIRDGEHSRVPVYKSTLDSIVGVLYAKDLLAIVHGQAEPPPALTDLLWEATFIPEAKKIDDLLREFQRERIHLAVVVDEYGGTAGIVTLEDILEELVGEIQDEYDREEPLVEPISNGVLRLDGRLDFDDFNELTDSGLQAEGVETVGGLVARELGRVARGGEEVSIGGWTFRVEGVEGKRILKLRAWRQPPLGEEGEPDETGGAPTGGRV